MPSLISLLLALVFGGGGIILSVLFVQRLRLRIAMARWPRVAGTVREHRVHSHRNRHGTGHHRPIVIVACVSAGRKWRLHCDSPTRLGYATEQAARSVMDSYPIGQSVKVYVDPKNPQRAFLALPEISALLLLSLGALFLFVISVGIFNGVGF